MLIVSAGLLGMSLGGCEVVDHALGGDGGRPPAECPSGVATGLCEPYDTEALVREGLENGSIRADEMFSVGLSFCYHQALPDPGSQSAGSQVRERIPVRDGEAFELLWEDAGRPGNAHCPFACSVASSDMFTIGENTSTAPWQDAVVVSGSLPTNGYLSDPVSVTSPVSDAFDIRAEFPDQQDELPDVGEDYTGPVCGFICVQDWLVPCDDDRLVATDSVVHVLMHHAETDSRAPWTEYRISKERH